MLRKLEFRGLNFWVDDKHFATAKEFGFTESPGLSEVGNIETIFFHGLKLIVGLDSYDEAIQMEGFEDETSMNEWQNNAVKEYTVNEFLNHAAEYLKNKPLDMVQASEKIWGCVVIIIKNFYAQMGVAIRTHNAITNLGKYATVRHPDEDLRTILGDTLELAHKYHENFYDDKRMENPEKFISDCKFFSEKFQEIDSEPIRSKIIAHIQTYNPAIKSDIYRTKNAYKGYVFGNRHMFNYNVF